MNCFLDVLASTYHAGSLKKKSKTKKIKTTHKKTQPKSSKENKKIPPIKPNKF